MLTPKSQNGGASRGRGEPLARAHERPIEFAHPTVCVGGVNAGAEFFEPYARRGNEAWAEAEALHFAAESELQALVNQTFEQILRAHTEAPAVIAHEVAGLDPSNVDGLGHRFS
jgi:hypothetical protein